MSRTVTLVIHGTFAAEAKWWQLGGDLFADRLEEALTRHGLQGTVWRPALEAGFDYKDFAWSGRNSHRDRLKAGRALADKINVLGERLGATSDEPMTVHLVAHSHGGNVVLEALKRLDPQIRPGNLVLLGTPLLRGAPAFRLARLLFASLLTSLAALLVTLSLISLIVLPVLLFLDSFRGPAIQIFLGLVSGYLLTFLLSHVFGVARWLLDAAWWACCLPFMFLMKRWRTQVYGPPPRDLQRRLGGRKILALWSPVDEAGLALLLSAAPGRYLQEKIRPGLLAYLNFFLFDFTIDLLEAFLERLVLGVGWWQVLFADFKVSEPNDRWAYPPSVMEREDVTKDLQQPTRAQGPLRGRPVGNPESQAILDRYDQILDDLAEVRFELRREDSVTDLVVSARKFVAEQINFRHSLYYDNERIVERTASVIAGLR